MSTVDHYREWLRRHPTGVFKFDPVRGHAFSTVTKNGVTHGSGPVCGAAPGPLEEASRCIDCEKVIEAVGGKL